MYLHIGENKNIYLEDMIGIFSIDMRNIQNNSYFLKKFPLNSLTDKKIKNNSSIVITKDNVYYSSISPMTLVKRIDKNE